MAARLGRFTSEKARQAFIRTHDELMDEYWPAPRDFVDVRTSFGLTRVQRNGEGDGIPLVLLSGAGGTPLGFRPVIEQLSAAHRVLTLETIGEPGHHLQERPVRHGEDLAAWLIEVLDGLGVQRAHLVGCSQGGWISLCTAWHVPERVASATVLDPPVFEPITWRVLRWLIVSGLLTLAPRAVRAWAARRMHNRTLLEDWVPRLMPKTARYPRALPNPPQCTDEQLAALPVPILFVLGGRSVLHDAAAIQARLAALPGITRTVLLPEAGHAVHVDEPERTVELVLDFIGTRIG